MTTVMAVDQWRTNGHLIADVARLYLDDEMTVLDPTYGLGRWWTEWRPAHLIASDLNHERGVMVADFTRLPWPDAVFDCVAYDPPYKLNGRPTDAVDGRYGVGGGYTSRDARMNLILDGLAECTRVVRSGGLLLVKCQDQVNGGKVRWQTDIITEEAIAYGLDKIDAFHMISYRPQPAGRSQQHARRNHSTLFVFRKDAA